MIVTKRCTDGDNYRDVIDVSSFCPGMNVVVGRTLPFQRQDDFPGNYPVKTPGNPFPRITSTYEFWVDGKKDETLQCFKSKGLNVNKDVSEDGDGVTTSIRGHVVLNLYDDPRIQYIFSGLNPNNITAPECTTCR